MASPICTVNGLSTLDGVDVAAGASVTIQLADLGGANQWSIVCFGTDELHDPAVVTSSLIIDQITKTATFTAPADLEGSALMFRSIINNQIDLNGRLVQDWATTFGIYVRTATSYRVAAFDETTEGSAAYGWTPKFNEIIRGAAGGIVNPASAGAGLTFGGGAYNVVAGDPSITVNTDSIQVGTLQSDGSHGIRGGGSLHALASGVTNGFMSNSDKSKLDAATSANTPDTLVYRDSGGHVEFSEVITENLESSGGDLTIGANGTTVAHVNEAGYVSAPEFRLTGNLAGTIYLPGNFSASTMNWEPQIDSTWINLIASVSSKLTIPLDVQNGMRLDLITIYFDPPAATPTNFPVLEFYRWGELDTSLPAAIATATDPGGGGYNDPHTLSVALSETVNTGSFRYFARFTPGYGGLVGAGLTVFWVRLDYTRLAGTPLGV